MSSSNNPTPSPASPPITIPSSAVVPSSADLNHALLSTPHIDVASLSPAQIAQLRDLVAASAARAAATGETATNTTMSEETTPTPIAASASSSFASASQYFPLSTPTSIMHFAADDEDENAEEDQEEGVVHSAPLPIESAAIPPLQASGSVAAPTSYQYTAASSSFAPSTATSPSATLTATANTSSFLPLSNSPPRVVIDPSLTSPLVILADEQLRRTRELEGSGDGRDEEDQSDDEEENADPSVMNEASVLAASFRTTTLHNNDVESSSFINGRDIVAERARRMELEAQRQQQLRGVWNRKRQSMQDQENHHDESIASNLSGAFHSASASSPPPAASSSPLASSSAASSSLYPFHSGSLTSNFFHLAPLRHHHNPQPSQPLTHAALEQHDAELETASGSSSSEWSTESQQQQSNLARHHQMIMEQQQQHHQNHHERDHYHHTSIFDHFFHHNFSSDNNNGDTSCNSSSSCSSTRSRRAHSICSCSLDTLSSSEFGTDCTDGSDGMVEHNRHLLEALKGLHGASMLMDLATQLWLGPKIATYLFKLAGIDLEKLMPK